MPVDAASPVEKLAPGAARTLVLGLGNPLLSDDGAGLRVARLLRSRLAGRADVDVDEDYWGGLRLIERMIGFGRAVVVDAICSGAEPGTVRVTPVTGTSTRHSASAHDVDLMTALAVGRQAGTPLPPDDGIRLVTIEAMDVQTFREECTPPVRAGVDRAVRAVMDLLETWR